MTESNNGSMPQNRQPQQPPTANNASQPQQPGPQQPYQPYQPPQNAPKAKKKMGKGKIAIIVIVVLLVLYGIGSCGNSANHSNSDNDQSSSTNSTAIQSSSSSSVDSNAEQQAKEQQALATARESLQQAIDGASSYLAEDYTPESFQALTTAVQNGQTTIANQNATENELENATTAISNAESSLVEAFDPADYAAPAFTDVARNPDSYNGQKLTFTGRVVQVVEGDTEIDIRLATDGAYDDIIMVGYSPDLLGGTRVLEDDTVTVYGTCIGLYTYTSTLGASISLPALYADQVIIG